MTQAKKIIAIALVTIMMSGCATVFGGPITTQQKRKPAPGEQQRQIRVVALIAELYSSCREPLLTLLQERSISHKYQFPGYLFLEPKNCGNSQALLQFRAKLSQMFIGLRS